LLRLYMVQLNKDTKVDTNFWWARMVRQTISTLLLRLIVFLWPCLPPVADALPPLPVCSNAASTAPQHTSRHVCAKLTLNFPDL
jgi:hypothetical protein